MIEIASDQRIVDYVCAKTGIVLGGSEYTTLGIIRDGKPSAGVLFNCFAGNDIHVTVCGTFFTRAFIARVRDYVFGELGCLRISITTQNPKVVKIAMRLGAKIEGCKRDFFGIGKDGVMLGLLKDEWKF